MTPMDRERTPSGSPPSSQHNDAVKTTGNSQSATATDERFAPPSIALPKGGGAVRGIGEKFAANPVTGTSSLTIPLPLSPGRSGFGPSLALSYDSGSAHGPFGLGWSLGLPSVTRKTDKGLPKYDDNAESDVFLLSGSEDLVPIPRPAGEPPIPSRTVDGVQYSVVRYRPRIEGPCARIERWTALGPSPEAGDTHWRSISRDNITTVYGKDDNSRIADPADPVHRVFSWLICESYNATGNAVTYRYAPEDSRGLGVRASAASEASHLASRTTARYLSSVRYGNLVSRLIQPETPDDEWLFELVFDYGGHDPATPVAKDTGVWLCRNDPFSNYRSGFDVRTYRLCQRVLMFHHFPKETGVGRDCLVRSMSLTYRQTRPATEDREDDKRGHPAGALLASVSMTGHRGSHDTGYTTTSLPPLELTYSTANVEAVVREVAADSLANLPIGVDGSAYQWVDLDGESISGVLSEQAGAVFYTANLGEARFAPTRRLPTRPNMQLSGGGTQLLDLDGDGQLDVVSFDGPTPGFFTHTAEVPGAGWDGPKGGWDPHRPIRSLPMIDWADPNLRFVDLNGDGHADLLLTHDDALEWYPSLGADGFGAALRLPMPTEESAGPRLVLANGTGSIYLADMSGDGLSDLVRVRNGEVCYWPSLGYGHFGAQIVMDHAPMFDRADQFDQRRLRLADVDGSGPTDLVYLGAGGADLYLNQMGNGWSTASRVPAFPPMDDLSSVSVVDLLGHGTACLVWSSPLPAATGRQMRYVDLMGVKPNLLTRVRNNLGAETVVHYSSSTTFYLKDQADGQPWITRLPFPVHVVDKVETYDWISRNRFVTRYAYHHGYFDSYEREFRGFAMVEQYDTEQLTVLTNSTAFPVGDNIDATTHLPPVLTKTWYDTGAYYARHRIAELLAGGYYPSPGAQLWRLPDTALDRSLTIADEREACRALKGHMLRQEVYALDGTDREQHPYTVSEHNYTVSQPAPRQSVAQDELHQHGVFAVQPCETLTVTCERDPTDPRIAHEFALDVDDYGNVTHSVTLAYRRSPPLAPDGVRPARTVLPGRTVAAQSLTLVTETRMDVTTPVDRDVHDPPAGAPAPTPIERDAFRVPVGYNTRTFQLTGRDFDTVAAVMDRAALDTALARLTSNDRQLVARQRTRFMHDDLSGPLDWGDQDPCGLPYEAYRLHLTPAIITGAFGNRVDAGTLTDAGYVEDAGEWWAPSGTVRYAPADVAPGDIHDHAATHFFTPHRFVDPFGAVTSVEYDEYDLVPVEVIDPVGNRVTAGERDAADGRLGLFVDYRVLTPSRVSDPNRNRIAVAYDALGLVVSTAVMGKLDSPTGDHVDPTTADLMDAIVTGFWADPLGTGQQPAPGTTAAELLGDATMRVVYDLDAYLRTAADADPQPACAATIAREQHVNDLAAVAAGSSPFQLGFAYSDGTGREIQHKAQAEPGPIVAGGPEVRPRWVGSGWTVFNNKGKPVRQYEPFFTDSHRFEFATKVGVSPVLCYDPPGRVIATIHPDASWDKVVIGAWEQETWDVNDTVTVTINGTVIAADPSADPDIGAYIRKLPQDDYLPTWYQARADADQAPYRATHFADLAPAEIAAATRTALHANTPTLVCFDALGRAILTVARNRTPAPMPDVNPANTQHRTHVLLDITGNQLEVRDCTDGTPGLVAESSDRLVARYTYDLVGVRVREESMEAGSHRNLSDIAGKPVAGWDHIDRRVTTAYDRMRRPISVTLLDPRAGDQKVVGRTDYGEGAPNSTVTNLRGRVWQVRDSAGLMTHTYDIAGNPASVVRTLARAYRAVVDWSSDNLETDIWTTVTDFDALGRPVTQTLPDLTVIAPSYNKTGLLETIRAEIAGDATDTVFVTKIDYDAKGQRTSVKHGKGMVTRYTYDEKTFRLRHLTTLRPETFTQDQRRVQDLSYVYDPAGNITYIRDDAQPTVFNMNSKVDPGADYTYDAVYRLVEANGREHLGLDAAGQLQRPTPTSWNDAPRINPADRNALGRYHERYNYDVAGNLTTLKHSGRTEADVWLRTFIYDEPSQLEPNLTSNRLTSTKVGSGPTETYSYDDHGNMLVLPPMEALHWNYLKQLTDTSRQKVNIGVPETTYYTYDATGERARKLTTRQAPTVDAAKPIKERIYLGAFEIYREFSSTGDPTLARTTIHIMDGTARVAMVETRTGGDDGLDQQLIRYQYSNHLGSATAELDATGEVISYEEYYPYGSTALAFTRSGAPPKRYRYTAKERDEETCLNYQSARYYACWLARWASCDPVGLGAGICLYEYAESNPVRYHDQAGTLGVDVVSGSHSARLFDETNAQSPGSGDDAAPTGSTSSLIDPTHYTLFPRARGFDDLSATEQMLLMNQVGESISQVGSRPAPMTRQELDAIDQLNGPTLGRDDVPPPYYGLGTASQERAMEAFTRGPLLAALGSAGMIGLGVDALLAKQIVLVAPSALGNAEGLLQLARGEFDQARGSFGQAGIEALLAWRPEREIIWERRTSTRAAEFREMIFGPKRADLTVSVGAFERPGSREVVQVVATNVPGSVALGGRRFLNNLAFLAREMSTGETLALGEVGHAERQALLWSARRGLRPIAMGASNRHCLICADLNVWMGGINSSAVRHPQAVFGD